MLHTTRQNVFLIGQPHQKDLKGIAFCDDQTDCTLNLKPRVSSIPANSKGVRSEIYFTTTASAYSIPGFPFPQRGSVGIHM